MTYHIDKVGIIGAGTMGGGIAAHLANMGIPVVLLDIPTPGLSDEEKDDPTARDRMVQKLYQRMTKARPANLAREDRANLITIGNTEDDFDLLADVDWVMEVIIERLDMKQALMARLEGRAGRVQLSARIRQASPSTRSPRDVPRPSGAFPGHPLLQPAALSQPAGDHPHDGHGPGRDRVHGLTSAVTCWARASSSAKIRPTSSATASSPWPLPTASNAPWNWAIQMPEMDAITGPTIGRPKTATFRLMDLVGLDVMAHVNGNLYEALPDDAYRETLRRRIAQW